MDDPEGVLSFDFEGGLENGSANPSASVHLIPTDASTAVSGNSASVPASEEPVSGGATGWRSYRQTVCRHWLRGLCMKGEACGFLHQYDKSRMPICRFFRMYGECREQDCVYKHTNDDIKECNMYKFGFCPNGPDCRYRHVKQDGPPPPVEEVFQKIQHLSTFNYGSNRFYQNRGAGYNHHTERPQFPQGSTTVNQSVAVKASTTADSAGVQPQQPHPQAESQQQQVSQTQVQNLPYGVPNQVNRTTTPLPQGPSRYFIVKSCNRENLELSVQQGVWATQRSNEAKLNEAFDLVEHVILIFSVNRTRHFQGCAKMTSKIGGFVGGGNWKHAHGTAHYGRNFSLKWLKLCELSFHKTHHLRNPYNENLPVKISRDCQELEPSIGEQLASLLYLEPDSELMAISIAAESKREDEKAKGLNLEGTENPDIVPFEDNEEEEEEESEEEDESFDQSFGAAQGRGRGRGVMWPQHMPIGRGGRPNPGIRGFPPVMMGTEGFAYGAMSADLFGPHAFPPYGPRFSGNFTGLDQNSAMGFTPMNGRGPTSGMIFHGRPSQPGVVFPANGLGMMMGPARAPFMGSMGMSSAVPVRGNRPMGLLPFRPPVPPPASQNSRIVNRDPRRPANDRNDRYSAGSDQGRGQEMVHQEEMKYQPSLNAQHEDSFGAGNSFRNDESESEDEAPRRSRHGEGRKKRRDLEEDEITPVAEQ